MVRLNHNFFGEYKGVAGQYSINYELVLRTRVFPYVLGTVGIGYYAHNDMGSFGETKWRSIPMRFKLCAGYGQFFAEVGYNELNARYGSGSFLHPELFSYSHLNIHFISYGLRFQPKRKGIFGSVELIPIKVNGTNFPYLFQTDYDPWELEANGVQKVWWYGLSLGYTF